MTLLSVLQKEDLQTSVIRTGGILCRILLKQDICPDCGDTQLNERARPTLLNGLDLPGATAMTLEALVEWTANLPAAMSEPLRPMAESIAAQFQHTAKRLTG